MTPRHIVLLHLVCYTPVRNNHDEWPHTPRTVTCSVPGFIAQVNGSAAHYVSTFFFLAASLVLLLTLYNLRAPLAPSVIFVQQYFGMLRNC